MESKIYLTIAISSFIFAFALIAIAGISTTAFVYVLAQEDTITPEGSVSDTLTNKNKGPSSTTTEFSAINASQWATNATLAYSEEGNDTIGMSMDNSTMMNATLVFAQGEESENIGGMSEDGHNTGMTEGLGNDTGGMSEGQTDPNGEGVDLGTGGP